jgi:hypothetical protein
MGFLNHATNNIIIDAVLTESGRELLANESFDVTSFAFGDDEVDYSIITKYGVSIGKEKIQKNTPIFEANPNESVAINSFLITHPNPTANLKYMPKLVWNNKNAGQTKIDLSESNAIDSKLSQYKITINNYVGEFSSSDSLDATVTDLQFYVKVHNKILSIPGATIIDTDEKYNVDTYLISSSTVPEAERAWTNQKTSTFSITSKGIVTDSTFKNYSSVLNSTKINTTIQIIGKQSGATLIIPVTITK